MKLRAHRVHDMDMSIGKAPRCRPWMDALPERYANRCLPLRIANESGWFLILEHTFEATWTGGCHQDSLSVRYYEGEEPYPASTHFGQGILTFSVPWLFETEGGHNLHVRGPANSPKYGASPLEGIVETDWSPYTFTMNWQMTVVNEPVLFAKGEPICQIVPVKRGLLEGFEPEFAQGDGELVAAHHAWASGREGFLKKLLSDDPETLREGWQRDYFRGGADRFEEHQTKLDLKEFRAPGL